VGDAPAFSIWILTRHAYEFEQEYGAGMTFRFVGNKYK